MQQFDAIVIGAGIAGCSIAYFLSQEGKSVAIVDSSTVASGASGAAGAFLSPMMGKPNRVLNMVNMSLIEALDLYKEIASDLLIANGLERFVSSDEDPIKFNELVDLITVPHEKRENSVFFYNAGVINAEALCKRLIANCTLYENRKVEKITQKDNGWQVLDLIGKIVVVATGAYPSLTPSKYMKMRGVWGERLALVSSDLIKHNISREVMISATDKNNVLAVGATHVRDKKEWVADTNAKEELFSKAIKMLPSLENSTFLDLKCGMRPSTTDYLPIAGRVIDVQKTLIDHPQIKDGKRVRSDEISYYNGLFIHTGHGGRGFVTAIHTAKKLLDLIVNGTPCEYEPLRLLINNVRRNPDKLEEWRSEWIAN